MNTVTAKLPVCMLVRINRQEQHGICYWGVYSLQNDLLITILASVFGVLVFILLMVFVYRRSNPKKGKGKNHGRAFNSEKVVAAARRFAGQNSFRFIAPARLGKDGAVADLDAVVVGYFGVLGVISLGYSGEIYGEAGEDTWLQVAPDGTRTRFENPVNAAAAAVRVVRDALFGQKMKKVPVEVVYVFATPDAQLAVPRSMAPMRLKQFKELLKKEKYLEDCGLDLDTVEGALRGALEEKAG